MSDKYILEDRKAVKCNDLMKWAKWYEAGMDNRRVASTSKDGVRVSTVFLGIDHSFGGCVPELFETMIFGGKHDEYQERCATWDQAIDMHKTACKVAFGDDLVEVIVEDRT